MDGREFWRAVDEDPELEVASVVEGASQAENHVVVRHLPSRAGHILPIREILRVPRDELFALLKFERPARIMKTWNLRPDRTSTPPAFERSVGRSAEPTVERTLEPVLIAS